MKTYAPGERYQKFMKTKMKAEFMPVKKAVQSKKKAKNWIAGAIKHPGALHRELGVSAGKKIPPKKLAAAAKKGGKIGKRARLAQTLKSFHKKRKSMKSYEGSPLDRKLDRITGFKEGGKKDEAMDRAIAKSLKKRKKRDNEKGEGKKHEAGESKAFEAKEKRRKKMMCKTHKKVMCKRCK